MTLLGNVSAVCRELGISRTLFYRWRTRLERYGSDGLHPAAVGSGRAARWRPRRRSSASAGKPRPCWSGAWLRNELLHHHSGTAYVSTPFRVWTA